MSLGTALVLLSGDETVLGSSRWRRIKRGARRAGRVGLAIQTAGLSEALRGSPFLGEEPLVLGSWRSLSRKAKNLARQGTHIALETGRAAAAVSRGDIGGALSKVASVTSGSTSDVAAQAADLVKSTREPEPPTVTPLTLPTIAGATKGKMGYLYIGGGVTVAILGAVYLVKSGKKGRR